MLPDTFLNEATVGRIYETMPFIKPKKVADDSSKVYKSTANVPLNTHYYKYGQDLFKQVTFEDSDRKILAMLHEVLQLCGDCIIIWTIGTFHLVKLPERSSLQPSKGF